MTEQAECRILDDTGRDLLGPVLVSIVEETAGSPTEGQWRGTFCIPRLKRLGIGEYRLCRVRGSESRMVITKIENGDVTFVGSGLAPKGKKASEAGLGDLT